LSGLGIVMKKSPSIEGPAIVLFSTTDPYQKKKPVFSLRAVIHEFFQKKFNSI
jgi:hypothetical protein